MKLLAKTNLYFVGASLIVFAVGGVFFFFLFELIIDRDLTNKLHARQNYVIKQIAGSDSLLLYQKFSANTLSVKQLNGTSAAVETISDTVLFDEIERKLIGYRQLSFISQVDGRTYRISIRRALVETKDLIKGVIALEAILFLAFVAILTVLNSQLSKRIWQPFYAILETISNYKPDRAESLHLGKNTITEFNELALAIEKMSLKINHEFNSQKEFTENASHEIQTPLAIIKNKLEVLLQTPGLNEGQMGLINSATTAANRLSRLNEALIILSRIENRQFHLVEKLALNHLIDRHLESLDELIQMKKITIRKEYDGSVYIKMNPFLADIMIENLIVNGLKHNFSPGLMSITIEREKLRISNTGRKSTLDPNRLFQRFAGSNGSLGLGLAIVKAICDTYLIPIHYSFQNEIHEVKVEFQKLSRIDQN